TYVPSSPPRRSSDLAPRELRLVLLGGDAGDDRVLLVEEHALRGGGELALAMRHPRRHAERDVDRDLVVGGAVHLREQVAVGLRRSEEHTSELQSRFD